MTEQNKQEPLIGWMIIEDTTEELNGKLVSYDGQITFPDPTGANLAWQNPIKMIEYSALEKAQAEIVELQNELAYYKNGTQIKEIHYDEHLAIDLAEKDKEIAELKQTLVFKDMTLKEQRELYVFTANRCGNFERENMKLKEKCDELLLWLDNGECFCRSCRNLALNKHQDKKEGGL